MNPVTYEKVYDHIDAGTEEIFIDKLLNIVRDGNITPEELKNIHWKSIMLFVLRKSEKSSTLVRETSAKRNKNICERAYLQKLSGAQAIH